MSPARRKSTKKTAKRAKRTGKRKLPKHRTSAGLTSKPGYGNVRQPFPPNLWTTFTYSETFDLAQTLSGSPDIQTYRLNGMYDPNQTGTGHQPRYFDTLLGADNGTAPYSNYRVYAAQARLTVYPTSTSATNSNGIIGLVPRRSNVASPATYNEIQERAYAKSKFISVLYVKPTTISNYYKIKTHLGHKDLADVDDSAAAYNGNPNEEVYLDICACAIDSSTGVMTVKCSITIVYFVQLYGLNDVADS